LSRPNSKKHSGNKIEIKIELTYAFSNRIPVWEPGRSVKLNFDSKTSILVLSEKQNAVKMGINEKRDVRFVKNVVSCVI